jgi:hypothetical protein
MRNRIPINNIVGPDMQGSESSYQIRYFESGSRDDVLSECAQKNHRKTWQEKTMTLLMFTGTVHFVSKEGRIPIRIQEIKIQYESKINSWIQNAIINTIND